MYQDISSGRKTEIDFLNGAIVSRAKKLGIDAPYNTFIRADTLHGSIAGRKLQKT
ncbi:MAG: ketopantoate reductase C-terminal domain-containing protein [Methanolobus sp.]